MHGQKIEFDHNTPEQIRNVLGQGRDICNAEYDGDDYPVEVLLKVIDLLAAKTIQFVQPQPVDLGGLAVPRMDIPRGRH
jgi:hypothetical protein